MSGFIVCGEWGPMQICKGDNQLTWANDEWPVTIFKTRRVAQGAITRSNNWRKKHGYDQMGTAPRTFVKVYRLAK